MRNNKSLSIGLAMILAMVFLTVSCAKKNVVKTTEPEASTISDSSVNESLRGDEPETPYVTLEADGTEFVGENIHFAFNSSILSEQAQKALSMTAQYLLMHPGVSLTVEGHCDERGTEAYNMVLGEQRAESVKTFLVDLGINAGRLRTISYGEERPIERGQNEASWAQNRRAQFVKN